MRLTGEIVLFSTMCTQKSFFFLNETHLIIEHGDHMQMGKELKIKYKMHHQGKHYDVSRPLVQAMLYKIV